MVGLIFGPMGIHHNNHQRLGTASSMEPWHGSLETKSKKPGETSGYATETGCFCFFSLAIGVRFMINQDGE